MLMNIADGWADINCVLISFAVGFELNPNLRFHYWSSEPQYSAFEMTTNTIGKAVL
jgi:hypothetical protein